MPVLNSSKRAGLLFGNPSNRTGPFWRSQTGPARRFGNLKDGGLEKSSNRAGLLFGNLQRGPFGNPDTGRAGGPLFEMPQTGGPVWESQNGPAHFEAPNGADLFGNPDTGRPILESQTGPGPHENYSNGGRGRR